MSDVTCLGIIVADVIVKTVDSLPSRGKLNLVDQLELHLGGCASNAAVDLEKLGVKTAVIGKVGDDGFGNFVVNEMRRCGVNTDGIAVSRTCGTSASVVAVHSSGERSFLHQLGANAELSTSDIDYAKIFGSKILFVAGALLMPSLDGTPTAEVLSKAQKAGILTIMDTAWDSRGQWMKLIAPCLPFLDYFIPSFEEAEMISGKKDPEEIADIFLEAGVKTAVIKLGKEGCFIKTWAGEKYIIDGFKGIEAVDTTGAGDAFAAGLIAGISNGWDLQESGRFANAVGAHCVMKIGSTSGIKTIKEILDFINVSKNGVSDVKQS